MSDQEDFSLGIRARATVQRVIDGDTLVLQIQLPLHIRLRDCWAPETDSKDEATKAKAEQATAQLKKLAPEGSPVILEIDTSDATTLSHVLTFGRILGDVFPKGDQDSLSVQMLRTGLATKDKT